MDTEIWAVPHGAKSRRQHLIIPDQLQESQAARCGAASPDTHWEAVETEPDSDHKRLVAAVPKCQRCMLGYERVQARQAVSRPLRTAVPPPYGNLRKAAEFAPRCADCGLQGTRLVERDGQDVLLCARCRHREEGITSSNRGNAANVALTAVAAERSAAIRASELARSKQRLAGKTKEQLYDEIMAGRQRKASR